MDAPPQLNLIFTGVFATTVVFLPTPGTAREGFYRGPLR
jgi:hypothetical protein